MLPSSSGSKNKPSKKLAEHGTYFMLVSCLAYPPTLKVEATCSFEASVNFQRHYILEDSILHNHRCENLKSYILKRVTIALEASKTLATYSASYRFRAVRVIPFRIYLSIFCVVLTL
jgi:hypothetical protein